MEFSEKNQGSDEEERSSEEEFSYSDETEESQDDDNDADQISPLSQNFSSTTAHRGTQLKCIEVKLQNVGLLSCYQLKMEVACDRCKKHVDLDVHANQQFSGVCQQCASVFGVVFRSEMMHLQHHILGYIDKSAVILVDVLPSCYNVICEGCGHQNIFKRVDLGGTINQANCMQCHKIIQVALERIQFVRVHNAAPTLLNLEKKRKKNYSKFGSSNRTTLTKKRHMQTLSKIQTMATLSMLWKSFSVRHLS